MTAGIASVVKVAVLRRSGDVTAAGPSPSALGFPQRGGGASGTRLRQNFCPAFSPPLSGARRTERLSHGRGCPVPTGSAVPAAPFAFPHAVRRRRPTCEARRSEVRCRRRTQRRREGRAVTGGQRTAAGARRAVTASRYRPVLSADVLSYIYIPALISVYFFKFIFAAFSPTFFLFIPPRKLYLLKITLHTCSSS